MKAILKNKLIGLINFTTFIIYFLNLTINVLGWFFPKFVRIVIYFRQNAKRKIIIKSTMMNI
jgi:hypothetical protein